MGASVLVCAAAEEVAFLQYHLLREAPDLVVDVTSDPFTAVETAARSRPDVVTVDLGLDGALDGAELIRRICASTPGTRVIARADSRNPISVPKGIVSIGESTTAPVRAARTAIRSASGPSSRST